jgi:adenylate cyclase
MGWIATALLALAACVVLALLLRRTSGRLHQLTIAHERASSQLQDLQQAFHRFAPQSVVEEIIERGVSIAGEHREVTILFADLAGFTALSETLPPETLVKVLNGYFEIASEAVVENGGYVSKFIGDGVMALFGAPESNAWQSLDAVMAALALQRGIEKYNASLRQQGLPALDVRIGVHRGPVVAGIFGSPENLEYTVIGDSVNTASRIQDLTREHGVAILVSAEVRASLDGRFQVRELPPQQVKGKAAPIQTFAVEDFAEGTPGNPSGSAPK